METVVVEATLAASVGRVWTLLGDMEALAAIGQVPMEISGTGVGATRTFRWGDLTIVERIDAIDHLNHSLTYTMIGDIPIPASAYEATMTLEALGDTATRFIWTGRFTPLSQELAAVAAAKARLTETYGQTIAMIRTALSA